MPSPNSFFIPLPKAKIIGCMQLIFLKSVEKLQITFNMGLLDYVN